MKKKRKYRSKPHEHDFRRTGERVMSGGMWCPVYQCKCGSSHYKSGEGYPASQHDKDVADSCF